MYTPLCYCCYREVLKKDEETYRGPIQGRPMCSEQAYNLTGAAYAEISTGLSLEVLLKSHAGSCTAP